MKSAILFTLALAAAHDRSHPDCVPYVSPPSPSGEIYHSLHAANEQVHSMVSMVDHWSADQGVLNALNIQQEYYSMYTAMQNLADAAERASFDRVDSVNAASEYAHHAAGITRLLNALVSKSEDFKSVHVETIIRDDVMSMVLPAAQVQSRILDRFPRDVPCDALSTASDACRHLTEALAHAGDVYNVGPFSFAPVPTACRPYC